MSNEIVSAVEAEETPARVCAFCGRIIEDGEDYIIGEDGRNDGEEVYICTDCVDDENVIQCEDCEMWFPADSDEIHFYDSIDKYICEYCEEEDYFRCDDCGEIHHNDEATEVGYDRWVCDDCLDHYYRCSSCGEYIYEDDVYWDDYDEPYCEDCYYERRDGAIWDYGEKPEPIFSSLSDETKDKLFMGFELEVDYGHNRENFAQKIKDAFRTQYGDDLCYCKTDGSLDNGFEIVTHPSTLDYYKSQKIFEKIDEMNKDGGYDFRSDQTSTCGLHVHVSRTFFGDSHEEQDHHIAKVVILLTRFWEGYLKNFTRRRGDYQWCQLNTIASLVKGEDEQIIAKKCLGQETRYVALNLYNSETIEFRIFKGTLNPVTAYASLELVDRMCRYAKDNTLSVVLNASWEDVFGAWLVQDFEDYYAELIAYCHTRGICNGLNQETTIPFIVPRDGYHYKGEIIKIKSHDEIKKILEDNGNATKSHDSWGDTWNIVTAEGNVDVFPLHAIPEKESFWSVVNIGRTINLRLSEGRYSSGSLEISRDTLEDFMIA